jgi:hypothetical protein
MIMLLIFQKIGTETYKYAKLKYIIKLNKQKMIPLYI